MVTITRLFLLSAFKMHYLILCSQQLREVKTTPYPHFRDEQSEAPTQGHIASKWQSQDLNSGLSALKCLSC